MAGHRMAGRDTGEAESWCQNLQSCLRNPYRILKQKQEGLGSDLDTQPGLPGSETHREAVGFWYLGVAPAVEERWWWGS